MSIKLPNFLQSLRAFDSVNKSSCLLCTSSTSETTHTKLLPSRVTWHLHGTQPHNYHEDDDDNTLSSK